MMVNFDAVFDHYSETIDLKDIAQWLGLRVKEENTIITAWPLRLGPKSSQEEHELLLASEHVASERYVEWERIWPGSFFEVGLARCGWLGRSFSSNSI